MITHRLALTASILIPALMLGGCAIEQHEIMEAQVKVAEPRALPVFSGLSGQAVTLDEVIAAAAGADVVVIGENHGHPAGLGAAAAIWAGVLEQAPKAALAMEFFERDEQSHVDDYLTGVTDEGAFKKATGRSESNYPAGHRAMVEAARTKGRPVMAANAPRQYVRLARLKGYEYLGTLTAEQRRLFRIPDQVPTGRYRDDFNKIMMGMGGHEEEGKPAKPVTITPEKMAELDATFRSQSMWDWTMAESIVRACEGGNGPVVHVVGRFHEDFGGGTIQAVQHLRPGVKIVTVSFVDKARTALADEDKGRADFVVYAGVNQAK